MDRIRETFCPQTSLSIKDGPKYQRTERVRTNIIKKDSKWFIFFKQKGNYYVIQLKIKPTYTKLVLDRQ